MAGAVRIETCPTLAVAQYRHEMLTTADWFACIATSYADIDTFTVDTNNEPTNTGSRSVTGPFIVLAIRCDP